MANEMDPSNLIQLLHEYESRMVPVIQDHGGNIDKFLGDGILATFGAVLSSDSYASDAMHAVDDLIGAADAWNVDRAAVGQPPISIGMAVVTGRIIFGAVGDETRLEYTVIGDPVNLCAKLEKHNRTALSRALTTYEAFDLAEKQGYAAPATRERHQEVAVEGVSTGVDLVVIAAR
jgi:adenylate cyclase